MNFPNHGKVLFSATLVRGHITKFHIPYLKWFKEQGWETWIAAKNDCPNGVCEIPYCDHFTNIDFARSPFSTHTLTAYRQLRELFRNEQFDIVHTHTPVGGVLTRLAARDARRSGVKVIYTAHGFHFYDGAPATNWLLWYPVERIMSRFTDVLVTINQEDYERARKFAHCYVKYIPGVGVDLSRFVSATCRDAKRTELDMAPDDYAVLAIGDINKNKNHIVLIKAMAYLPKNIRLYIAGEGPLMEELGVLADKLEVSRRVTFLGFRQDVAALLNACDLFCLPSKREGLPVSLIEAMATGMPCLASDARGCADVMGDATECLLSRTATPADWADAIRRRAMQQDVQNFDAARHRAARFGIESVIPAYQHVYQLALAGEEG